MDGRRETCCNSGNFDVINPAQVVSDLTSSDPTGRLMKISDSAKLAILHGLVDGDVAEFGISTGVSWEVLAATIAACETSKNTRGLPPKTLYGFDSFRGMPEAKLPEDTESPMVQRGIWRPGSCISPGKEAIRSIAIKYLPVERVQLYKGWFSETLYTTPPLLKFCCVHIDCDFYESTAQVLEFLFETDRLSDGCIVLFDDFLESRGSKKLGQRRAWIECVEKYAPDYTDLGYYGIASWRCIIHRD